MIKKSLIQVSRTDQIRTRYRQTSLSSNEIGTYKIFIHCFTIYGQVFCCEHRLSGSSGSLKSGRPSYGISTLNVYISKRKKRSVIITITILGYEIS